MKVHQTGGYVLETEEAFFEWLEKDSNIEDLLKSTLQFLEYKTKVASSLVKSSMDELDQYWKTKLMSRIQTKKTVEKSFQDSLKLIKIDALSHSIAAKKNEMDADIRQLSTMASLIQSSAERDAESEEAKYISRLSSQINQTQTLKGLYDAQKKEICTSYFAKKGNKEAYKAALNKKRISIRGKVNEFIESFTGESNRRHRLYILNYAIDFAQNWTSFQGNYKLNLLITGGAGLGKTTFAKAIGKLFFEFGLLARDLFQIREKTDFIGQYVGQTPMKTYSTLYSALESMLFIDEAYSVSGCGTGATFDYGQEFIDALVDVSQKTRGLISIVAAGYKSEIHNCFLDKNPGMRRRFPNELELTPYSSIDLDNILTNNVLRPIFGTQLDSVLKMDLLKEPEIYFQNPSKFQEFGKEIFLRLAELGTKTAAENSVYGGLAENGKRAASLKQIAESKIKEYPLILRYRTKIIGLYRFFMQLASFDTNFSSFEAMYNAHQFLWKMVTDNNPQRAYKYNNYRVMHLIYLSNQQQRREIMKSYLLRKFYSEKEGSLFPNQAGDMDTLAAFIKSQPNLRLNTIPTFDEVTKLYNEYFRSRGGSKFILKATKTGDAIELLIYHIGGGFLSYPDFEEGVLSKIFKSLTYDGQTISALWNLNAQTPEHRETIIQKINSFYSQACLTLLREAQESMKTNDSNEKNEKRLPSGIDIRFLEAEAMSFLGANQGNELGDESKIKYLDYVSFGDLSESDDEMRGILNEITRDAETVDAPKTLMLDDAVLCRDVPEVPKVEAVAPLKPVAPLILTVQERDKIADELAKAKKRLQELVRPKNAAPAAPVPAAPVPAAPVPAAPVPSAPKAAPAPSAPAAPVAAPPLNPPLDNPAYPLKTLRVFIDDRKKGPKNFSKMASLIQMTRLIGETTIQEEYKLNLYELPHVSFSDTARQALVNESYYYFLVEWTKGQGAPTYKGQGFVYALKGSKQCSDDVPLFRKKDIPKRFYEFVYLGRLDEVYPGLNSASVGKPMFTQETKSAKAAAPVPPPVPSLSSTRVEAYDKALKEMFATIYPPTRLELATYKTKITEGANEAAAWLDQYKKTKAQEVAADAGYNLNEPYKLYYGGSKLTKFSDLVEKELSISSSFHALTVAKVTSLEIIDGEAVTTIEDDKGNRIYYRVYQVKYLFTEDGLMKSGQFYYGLKVSSAESTVSELTTYPLELVLLDLDEEDEEEEEEEEDIKSKGKKDDEEVFNVQFVNDTLKGAAADLNQLVGTTNES